VHQVSTIPAHCQELIGTNFCGEQPTQRPGRRRRGRITSPRFMELGLNQKDRNKFVNIETPKITERKGQGEKKKGSFEQCLVGWEV